MQKILDEQNIYIFLKIRSNSPEPEAKGKTCASLYISSYVFILNIPYYLFIYLILTQGHA